MAASWITQMGEEDLSETEAVDSFIAMNEHRKRTWAQAQELKKAARRIVDSSHHVQQFETERMLPDS